MFATVIVPVVSGVVLIGVLAVAVVVVAATAGAVAAHLLKKRTPALFAAMGRHRE